MTDHVWRGCVVPDDRLYDLDLHVWAKPDGDEVVLGMTDVAQAQARRMVGPFPTPLTGELVSVNSAAFEADVAVANRDPYGLGWLARVRPSAFAEERHHLTEGSEAIAAYRSYIDDHDITCLRCSD